MRKVRIRNSWLTRASPLNSTTNGSPEAAEKTVTWQLQRSRGQLHHRETETPGSEATLPLPDICVTALKLRAERQARDRAVAEDAWQDTGLVFTTTYGTPYEPRNFARHFALRRTKAGVRYIKVHDTRRTCGSLLAALDLRIDQPT